MWFLVQFPDGRSRAIPLFSPNGSGVMLIHSPMSLSPDIVGRVVGRMWIAERDGALRSGACEMQAVNVPHALSLSMRYFSTSPSGFSHEVIFHYPPAPLGGMGIFIICADSDFEVFGSYLHRSLFLCIASMGLSR